MAWISANRHCHLRICFRFRGVECKEGTKLKDTPANRRLLEQKADQIQYEIDHGLFDYRRHFPHGTKAHLFDAGADGPAPSAMIPFAQYAVQWLEENAYSLTPATYRSYRTVIHSHVVPFFKELPLGEITDTHLKRFVAHLQALPGKGGRPMASKSINNYLGPVKGMLRQAAEKKLLTYDPTLFVKRLRVPKPDIDPFTPEEIAQFLAHVTPRYRTYFHVAFLTGMRPNEQLALKWANIDFVHRKIGVREGRVGKVEGLPKTEESIRDIDLLEPVCELLRRHRAETWLRTDYVFVNQEGRPIDLNTLRRRIWYPALKRGGIRARTLYQTRHTFATLMLATGENPEWIAKQLGHTSTQMLFQRYAKFIPNVTRRDGAAFLQAYRNWFAAKDGVEVGATAPVANAGEQGSLGSFYDTFTPPQQQRDQADRLTP
jgi:integrase